MTEQTKPALGITAVKEELALIFGLGKAVKQAKDNDGKINAADLPLVMSVIPLIAPAFNDLDKVVPELKDLDEAEITSLAVYLGVELTGVGAKEKLVEQVAKGLEVAKALYSFVKVL